ncbi:MAG: proline dehydrogenase family protein [Halobacteriales archaeon]
MLPPIASRFVAGETAAEALDRARRLNGRDVGAILNLLGEHHTDRRRVERDAGAYRRLLGDLAGTDLRARVSVKPSQLGLEIGAAFFEEQLRRVIEATPGGFVWIDMEGHETVDATLSAYETLAREHPGRLGVCVQANLKRTRADLDRLADVPGKVRLVKGAYDPPRSVAYRKTTRVNEAYESLLEFVFREFDGGIAVGSHDPRMIEYAEALSAEHGTGFEIQMLMGVREDAQFDLADEHDVWQYVPYGSGWLAYFYRRVKERRENATFALRALVSGS